MVFGTSKCEYVRINGEVCNRSCMDKICSYHTKKTSHVKCEKCQAKFTRSKTKLCRDCVEYKY